MYPIIEPAIARQNDACTGSMLTAKDQRHFINKINQTKDICGDGASNKIVQTSQTASPAAGAATNVDGRTIMSMTTCVVGSSVQKCQATIPSAHRIKEDFYTRTTKEIAYRCNSEQQVA